MHINSVSGPIHPNDLGTTLVHEHLRIRSELVGAQFPHVYDDEIDLANALTAVSAVQERGVTTVCDPTIPGLGRDVRFAQGVVRQTGIQLVMGTGLYTFDTLPARFQTRSIDYLADLFVHDIEVGMQGTPARAGFLKCVMDEPGLTPDVEKTIRATARAHVRTGAPVMTHSHPNSASGLTQLDILEQEGVPAHRVLVGHSGDTDDIGYLTKLLDRGVYLGLDRYGITDPVSTEQRNATVTTLVGLGFTDHLLISQDYCCSIEHAGFKENYQTWSMTLLFDHVFPALLHEGVTQNDLDRLLTDNVRAWLTAA